MTYSSPEPTIIPELTIIIATFNAGQTVERCLSSIASQTFEDYELIVMDGKSTDDTLEKIMRYKEICSYIESSRDNGIYSAWNKALDKAKGIWVMFIGADDYLPNDTILKDVISFASGTNANLITVRNAEVDSSGTIKGVYGEPWSWNRFRNYMNICHVGVLHQRTLFENYGYFDECYKIAGDYEFLMRVKSNLRVEDFNKVVACCGNSGVSHTKVFSAILEAIRLQQKYHSTFLLSSIARYGAFYFKRRFMELS